MLVCLGLCARFDGVGWVVLMVGGFACCFDFAFKFALLSLLLLYFVLLDVACVAFH